MKLLICFVLFIFIQCSLSFSLHYNFDAVKKNESTDVSPDSYMSPFRRAREKSISLALKSGKQGPKNELDKPQYQNYKIKKLSAKVALEQKKPSEQLRPLSMRTLSLKNNPFYGQNPNSVAYIKTLSSQLPGQGQIKPTAFNFNYQNQFMNPMMGQMNSMGQMNPMGQMNSMGQMNPMGQMNQMQRMRPEMKNPKRMNNTLREQRLKLLEDENFLRSNSKLGQFIFSRNRDSILMNQMDQMNKENEMRRNKAKPKVTEVTQPKVEDLYRKPTKASKFRFEKNEIQKETVEKKEETVDDNEEYDETEEEEHKEKDQTLRVKSRLPYFKDVAESASATTTTTSSTPVFSQSQEARIHEVKVDTSNLPLELLETVEEKSARPTVRKLSLNKGSNLIDWDEMEQEEEEYRKTLELRNAMESILNLKKFD